jgi:hypothetical protein
VRQQVRRRRRSRMPAEINFDPDVFHGELTANRAQVFVRLARSPEFADCTLHGYVHGPRCEFAHTLPAKYTLTDLGAGPTLLARTTITDPCLWTSDLPQIYDVHIELRRGSEVLAREQRMLGLRGIGARSTGQLAREGKVWVPRGVAVELLQGASENESVVAELREELLVGICTSPPLDLLVEASRRGAYLIANLSAARSDFEAALRSLARWPAVMLAIIHGGENLDRSLQQVSPNLLLAQPTTAAALKENQPAPWAAALAVEMKGTEQEHVAATVPILAVRATSEILDSAAQGRAACDRLQRDLSATRQFAGYLLTQR